MICLQSDCFIYRSVLSWYQVSVAHLDAKIGEINERIQETLNDLRHCLWWMFMTNSLELIINKS